MMESNLTRSINYGKKSLKWAAYAAGIFAVIGSFGCCLTTPDDIWDSKGCLTAACEKIRMSRGGEDYNIPIEKQREAEFDGFHSYGISRKATSNEKSSMENERFFYGALICGLGGAMIGSIGPLLISFWFFFLLMVEQFVRAARTSPSKHNVKLNVKTKVQGKKRGK